VLRRPLESTQYLAIRYTDRLAEAGAVASVGSTGDSYDNALAESFNGLFKTELIHARGPWRGMTRTICPGQFKRLRSPTTQGV
jgi:putative transposase